MLRAGLKDIADFDDKLRQFQAITETTNTEMVTFRDRLLDVAATSRFSVTELAAVSIQLGQIGLSARGVGQTLKPVLDLAAASGSTLQQSVEAITSVLGAYNLEAARSGDVADVFVGALNRTKLGMEQLQLGVSYAANVARDSGVSFTELTAALGGMAQGWHPLGLDARHRAPPVLPGVHRPHRQAEGRPAPGRPVHGGRGPPGQRPHRRD